MIDLDNISNQQTEFIKTENHIPVYQDEFWTAKQRQMSSLHEISYRACFKGELPHFFIDKYSQEGDVIYDPFAGRGTTAVQASLMGRRFISNDINPLSAILAEPRTNPPSFAAVAKRLEQIPLDLELPPEDDQDLLPFYHPETLQELKALRYYLQVKRASGTEDILDRWIRMVATNRLTGHSSGFFSYYTMPPNLAVSPERQKKINLKYSHKGFLYKDVKALILKKTKSLLKDKPENWPGLGGQFLHSDAAQTYAIADNSVKLIITSPPFLDQVQYVKDNWLRCWFNHLDADQIERRITHLSSPEKWSQAMGQVFREFYRVLQPGGLGAFEVGEVRKGKIYLEDLVLPGLIKADLVPQALLINSQEFSKTANIWGVKNNLKGTNTNRIILFQKE